MRTTTFTEPKRVSDVVLQAVHGISKDNAVLGAGTAVLGTVLARVSGKYQPVDFAGTSAAKKAAAVALQEVDATDGEKPVLVLARMGSVAADSLVWPAGATDAQIASATDELDARGIVVRATL